MCATECITSDIVYCILSKVVYPSTLVQTGRATPLSAVLSVAEVHQPSRWAGTGTGQSGGYNVQYCRSYSVESSQEPVLSRRQILASLEEDNGVSRIPPPSPSLSSSCTWSSSSSSPSPLDSENSFSGSPYSSSEGVFSRACLIQSISREEEESPG